MKVELYYGITRLTGFRLFPNAVILGDNAYPLRTWLMTSNINNVNRNKNSSADIEAYLTVFRKTRFRVENSIGILKQQFPCLKELRLSSPLKASNIANACVILHNVQNKYCNTHYNFDAMDERNSKKKILLENYYNSQP